VSEASWTSGVSAAIEAIQGASEEAVRDVTEDLLAVSQARTPYDQGDLQRSGKASVDGGGDIVQGAVSYDMGPYDEIQHRREDFHHEVGTDHYLSGPLDENRPRYHAYIAGKIGKALG
jgi:hypothetical protein